MRTLYKFNNQKICRKYFNNIIKIARQLKYKQRVKKKAKTTFILFIYSIKESILTFSREPKNF